jgi:tetratricopeptide (TPR) repeat protein
VSELSQERRGGARASRFAWLAFALWASCAAATDARAQDTSPPATDPADDARARELYILGDEFYANGRYEAAEEAFAEAYRLSGRPLLLFNLANAQERSGRWPEAAANLQRYRQTAPESERPALDARLGALARRIAERDAESHDEPVVVIQHESAELPLLSTGDVPAPREPVRPAWVLLPAAGALAVTTVPLAVRVRGVRDDVRAACTTQSGQRLCLPGAAGVIAQDRRLSVATDLFAAATLATAALGVWSHVRSRRASRPNDRTLQVGVAPGVFRLAVGGTF